MRLAQAIDKYPHNRLEQCPVKLDGSFELLHTVVISAFGDIKIAGGKTRNRIARRKPKTPPYVFRSAVVVENELLDLPDHTAYWAVCRTQQPCLVQAGHNAADSRHRL